jgi:hypothetical protein
MDFTTLFNSVAALTLAVIALSEFINRFWILVDVAAQVRTLVVGVVLGMVGSGFHLGMFADLAWQGGQAWWLVGGLVGLLCGLVGNWSFATPIVQWLLAAFKITTPTISQARNEAPK